MKKEVQKHRKTLKLFIIPSMILIMIVALVFLCTFLIPHFGESKNLYLYDFTDEQLEIIYDEFNLNIPDTIKPQYLYYYDQGWTLMPVYTPNSILLIRLMKIRK